MRVITLNFDVSVTGVADLENPQPTGDIGYPDAYGLNYVRLNPENIGAYTTIQTIFSGTPPKYTIECNLGIINKQWNYTTTRGNWEVDPDGWVSLPASTENAGAITGLLQDLIAPVIAYFQHPVFALRINISEAGTGTGTFKVLSQGIA